MLPDDRANAYDIVRFERRAVALTSGVTYEQFARDEVLRLAIERLIQIVGEAAWRLSREFKDSHPTIPWHKVEAQRHRLVHDYGRILPDLIWDVATVHANVLADYLEPLLPKPPDA
jgi:uncharacterized protein with HEPN domain